MVYTVETPGDTDVVPPAVGVTVPIPLLMLTEVEFALVHVRTEDSPFRIEAGAAERVQLPMSSVVTELDAEAGPVPAELALTM